MELLKSPLFYLILSFFSYEAGAIIYKKSRLAFLNPLLIGIILVILFLKLLRLNYTDYSSGTQIISFLLGPATVVLAVPLYNKIKLLRANYIPIMAGIILGSLSGIVSIIFLCHAFGLNNPVGISLIPKSVTTPIGIAVSKQLGGIPAVTVTAIILTGIIGSVIGPSVFKLFRIKDKIAIGIAYGTASHAVGTSKAMETGETEGAMSSLAIGVAGLITVLIAPLLFRLLHNFI